MQEGHVKVDEVEEICVLVGVVTPEIREDTAQEYLDELEFLAETAGAITQKKFLQKLPMAHPRTFVGKGKIQEIKEYIKENGIELVIFDEAGQIPMSYALGALQRAKRVLIAGDHQQMSPSS